MVSARIFTDSFEKFAHMGVAMNAAANYGLEILIKAHQRGTLYTLGFPKDFFSYRSDGLKKSKKPTTLRIRHDYLDYIEMQGLNRNKMLNYAIVTVCSLIENYQLTASAITEGAISRGIARRNVYTNGSTTGEEGQEP